MKHANPECPCGSGAKYGSCCRTFHRGAEAPTAEALMRSRFSAYAVGDTAHLWRTLDESHPDRAGTEAAFLVDLRAALRRFKYVRLHVLEAREDGDAATVTFRAEVFEKGQDRSFTEKSLFAKRGAAWRYVSGT